VKEGKQKGKDKQQQQQQEALSNEPSISFRELVIGLSVMTRGNQEEKLNCMFTKEEGKEEEEGEYP
jgi:hypothetical protein